jgi:hypothetical protein
MRFRSVICLLDESQLRLYQNLPCDLMSYYRENGLRVEHIPVRNYKHPALSRLSVEESLAIISAVGEAGLDALQRRNRSYGKGRVLHQAKVKEDDSSVNRPVDDL